MDWKAKSIELKDKSKEHRYLHHYTSVQTLKLILRNRKFKFSRTDQVNDLDEAARSNICESDFYVSCFTHNEDNAESIPLWYIYTNQVGGIRNGIRITFRNDNIFSGTRISFGENPIIYFTKEIISSDNRLKNVYKFRNGYIEATEPERTDIEYSDELLIDSSYYFSKKFDAITVDGIYPVIQVGIKSKAWEYESETRYYVSCSFLSRLDVKSIYVEFDEIIYDDFTITFNPFMSMEEKEILKSELKCLLEQSIYDKIIFANSKLKIRNV